MEFVDSLDNSEDFVNLSFLWLLVNFGIGG